MTIKKFISMFLALALCLGTVTLAGCGHKTNSVPEKKLISLSLGKIILSYVAVIDDGDTQSQIMEGITGAKEGQLTYKDIKENLTTDFIINFQYEGEEPQNVIVTKYEGKSFLYDLSGGDDSPVREVEEGFYDLCQDTFEASKVS